MKKNYFKPCVEFNLLCSNADLCLNTDNNFMLSGATDGYNSDTDYGNYMD